jgi:hypothetical protein
MHPFATLTHDRKFVLSVDSDVVYTQPVTTGFALDVLAFAATLREHNLTEWMNSSSIDFPEEWGLPEGFSFDASFQAALRFNAVIGATVTAATIAANAAWQAHDDGAAWAAGLNTEGRDAMVRSICAYMAEVNTVDADALTEAVFARIED